MSLVSDALSRRSFLKASAAASTLAVANALDPRAASAASKKAQGSPIVLRCLVLSDVHFNGSPDSRETARFKSVLKFMYEYSEAQPYDKFDALVVVGDMSNNGTEPQIRLFKGTMDAGLKEGTKALLCMGNHEFYGGNPELWSSVFGVKTNDVYEVNGFSFIAVSPEKGTMADGDYLYAEGWLKTQLENVSKLSPDKPIFVFQHYPVSPTVYGGRGADDWGANDLFSTLQLFPRVINFSGHTHYPLRDPRIAWQGNFSAFGTSTLSYICHGGEGKGFEQYPAGSANYAECYVMEVHEDNSVDLLPYDVEKGAFYDVKYRVAKPGDPSTYEYTDARYYNSPLPVWGSDAQDALKIDDVTDASAALTIPNPSCEGTVYGYRVELERLEQDAFEPEAPKYIRAPYYEHTPPEITEANLEELAPNAKYRGRVYALNPFMREAETHLTFEFQTAPEPVDPAVDKTAPCPSADLIDVRVVDGVLVNAPVNSLEKQKECQLIDGPVVVKDETRGTDVVAFDGEKSFARIVFEPAELKRLRRATISARFCAAKDGAGSCAIFGDTEFRGIEFAVDYNLKTLRLWATVNNAPYTILDAPIEFGKWYDAAATFDGSNLVLYLDGKEVARAELKGQLTHPTDTNVNAFTVGADIAPGGAGSYFFKGRVERARLYSWALTPQQVAEIAK